MPNKIIIHPWSAVFEISAFLFDCYAMYMILCHTYYRTTSLRKINASSNDDGLDKIVHLGY